MARLCINKVHWLDTATLDKITRVASYHSYKFLHISKDKATYNSTLPTQTGLSNRESHLLKIHLP